MRKMQGDDKMRESKITRDEAFELLKNTTKIRFISATR